MHAQPLEVNLGGGIGQRCLRRAKGALPDQAFQDLGDPNHRHMDGLAQLNDLLLHVREAFKPHHLHGQFVACDYRPRRGRAKSGDVNVLSLGDLA